MGQIADDIIDGACCALCGCYFATSEKDTNGSPVGIYEHGCPVVCTDCWEPGVLYGKADKGIETF